MELEVLPLEAIDVMVRLRSEGVDAMRTTAEIDLLPVNFFLHCQRARFFRQAGGAYDKIADLLQISLGVGDKYFDASLATEVVILAGISRSGCLIPADRQPDE